MSPSDDSQKQTQQDEQHWVEKGELGYDPDRWDPDTHPSECQVCGHELYAAGDRATVGEHCSECRVQVWIR